MSDENITTDETINDPSVDEPVNDPSVDTELAEAIKNGTSVPENIESKLETQPEDEPAGDEPEKYTLKVNGQENQYTLDELMRMASKGQGAEEKFRQAADSRRQLEDIFVSLKNDPVAVLNKMGLNTREIFEDYLSNISKVYVDLCIAIF